MNIAFIMARGGSTRVPGKALRMLGGRPLIAHAITSAINANLVDKVVIDSDDDEILRVGANWGAQPIKRPKELAGNDTSGDDLMYYQAKLFPEARLVLQVVPTSPFISSATINKAIQLVKEKQVDTVIGAREEVLYIWNGSKPMHYQDGKLLNSFEMDPVLYETTGLYVNNRVFVMKSKSRCNFDNCAFLHLPKIEAVDINDSKDLQFARILYDGIYPKPKFKLSHLLDGKRVAFVGPAAYVEDRIDADLIQSYDVVVRMLKSLPIEPQHYSNIGWRTDIVASSLLHDRGIKSHKDEYEIRKVGNIIIPVSNTLGSSVEKDKRKLEEVGVVTDKLSEREYFSLKGNMGTRPTTGALTIYHLLLYDLKELYLTGLTIDCRISPRISSYHDRIVSRGIDVDGWHNIEKEVAWFKELRATEPRLTMDDYMKGLFVTGDPNGNKDQKSQASE